jgi:hypothetical protein
MRTLDFVANADAAGAEDAAVVVDSEEPVANIYGALRIRVLPAYVVDFRIRGKRLKLAVAVRDANGADVVAFGKKQFDYHPSIFFEPVRIGTDLHTLGDLGNTGRLKLVRAFHLHET